MTPEAQLGKDLAFSTAEFAERCRRLRALMIDARLDVMLVHQPPSVFYFSGYDNLHVYDNECVIVPLDREVSLLVDEADTSRARLTSWVDRCFSFPPEGEAGRVLAGILREQGLARARAGVEKQVPRAAGLSVHTYEVLCAALPYATFVDASGLPERVKMKKSPSEIACHRLAASFTDAGMRAALESAREGRTDNEVAAAAYHAMIGAGSEFLAIPAIVNCGRASSVSHSTHKGQRLEAGDVVFLELGGCWKRYTSPAMRTASIGAPSDDVKRLSDACLAALEEMHAVMKPGVFFDDVARAGARGVARAGRDVDWNGDYGYSVGAGFPPHWGDYTCQIRLGSRLVLEEGMVFHQPIALRLPGKVGVAFSETVLITPNGCEALTTVPRQLVTR
jgi:Xaa-Pro dipeptidase